MNMKLTANLAYIVGLLATDGNLSNDGRHINLTSKDKEQIETFARILNLDNKVSLKKSGYSPSQTSYFLQFGNVKFYKFLIEIELTPNKTKTIGKLKIPKRYFPDFLRGHFDGDGCTYSYFDKRWKNSFMLYTSFTSASEEHLKWIEKEIFDFYGLKGSIGLHGSTFFNLRYAKKASIKLLKIIYYNDRVTCLKRKWLKIKKSLGIINQ